MKIKILSLFVFFNIILIAQENLDIPITPSKDQELDIIAKYGRSLSKFDGTPKSYSKLKYSVSVLESKNITYLKNHPSYSSLGDVYMYAAMYLQNEYKEDKVIELYDKALKLRADPNSNYALALIYKNKYDNAIKQKDSVKEVEYAKKVYEYLNTFVILSGKTSSKKYQDILNYFSTYK